VTRKEAIEGQENEEGPMTGAAGALAPVAAFDHKRAAWLEERRNGIGASEAPVVMGVSKFQSPLDLWAQKRGLVPADSEGNEAMEIGLLLEPVILGLYARRRGVEIERPEPYTLVRSKDKPFMFATFDGFQSLPDKGRGVVEIKATGMDLRDGEEPPESYQVQIQHQMAVAGVDHGTIVALIRGQRLAWWDVERHAKFLRVLTDAELAFWKRVENGEPPEPVDPGDTKALLALHPRDNGTTVELPELSDVADEIERLEELRSQAKDDLAQVEAALDVAKNRIKAAMGPAAVARVGRALFGWKAQAKKGYFVQPSETRVFRRLKG
jgi:putative phage-type endonuclease